MTQSTKTTKWKYGTVPASARLTMLRKGNKELYDEEIARTRDAITARLEAGLPVDEQMKWGDTVSYQYNLSQAEKNGERPESVAETGYAKKLFSDLAVSDGEKTSTPEKPEKIASGSYRDAYKNESGDTIAKATRDAYAAAVNRRLSDISAQYNRYVRDINDDYARQKKQALAAYEQSEKIEREKELNDGRPGGGRSETAKLKSRQTLNDYLAELDRKKTDALTAAHETAQQAVYDVRTSGLSELSDEFYRYNQLYQKDGEIEYQKNRDAAEDEKWYTELTERLKGEQLDREALNAYRSAQLEQQRRKEENDLALARDQLEYKKEADNRDYEKWLREFEEETAQGRSELARKWQSDRDSVQLSREKAAREAENAEKKTQSAQASQEEFGRLYASVLAEAEYMHGAAQNRGNGRYALRYTDQDVLEYIARQDELTARERLRIIKALGLDS